MSTVVQGYQVLSYVLGILVIVLNGVLLASMCKERKKIFVTRVSYLVASLAVADCLNGLFLIIIRQPIKAIEFKSDIRTIIELPLVWIVFCASFLTLFLMAAERLIIVALPMDWSNLLTIPRTISCILIVWLLSIACGVAIHYKRFYTQLVFCSFIEISALCFVAIHVYILWVFRRREQHRFNVVGNQATPRLTDTPRNQNIVHRKVSIVVTILLTIYIITSVPFFVCVQMFTLNNAYTFHNTLASKANLDIYDRLYIYMYSLIYVNCLSNPIICAWRLRMYRKAFYSLLRQCKPKAV